MLSLDSWLRIGAVLAIAGGLMWSHSWAYRTGRSVEQKAFVQKINQENKEAGNAAEDWRARYRRCAERGGLYDFETGACNE
ncbi:hypothetical protein [Nitratireductor indicus]|uniref:Transmembrane protein n=1 Tax=Nitratireductor indicus C115 TaxID=1231190 RepID=K2P284_9HYPH|nr:hypothetical protein [Nitratireductor indicus]EKF41476.1 hypothetical protein NA8A_14736 [Nitratireductor indicus C115]MDS1136002.1 hypothetical protein [Nitratireductor indicus]SFQ69265.1 hypothetical protein SAMN05216176_1109 [Nitratireductor indicus]